MARLDVESEIALKRRFNGDLVRPSNWCGLVIILNHYRMHIEVEKAHWRRISFFGGGE